MDELEERFSKILHHEAVSLLEPAETDSAAAVLILLIYDNEDWKIVYTRRTTNVRTHQGEVSFPGGAYEKVDRNMVQTALRETHEEIGVKPECIKIIGGLDPIHTISNFMVYPFVGIMKCAAEFVVNSDEVERVFMIPLKWLENSSNYFEQDHLVEKKFVRKVIHYRDFEGEHLWGLTARITQQLLEIQI
jgi:8-oxo-dGTP pyrophosphatase MutT (NUDIX family)